MEKAGVEKADCILERFCLKGKTAIVTGGNTGLGADMALALAQVGANVIVTSRSLKRAKDAARELSEHYGINSLGLELVQQEWDSVEQMAGEAASFQGRIDILVNNAGGGAGLSDGDFAVRDIHAMEEMIAVNLMGVLYCCRAVAGYMIKQGRGKIVNIASVAGMVGRNRIIYKENGRNQQPVEYAAAKSGVIGMSRDLAAYLAPYGIHVNSLSPGLFNKGELSQGFDRDSSKKIPLGHMGHMGGDIMGPVLFLCSSASDYVTGHNLVVDGGFSIYR